MTINNEDIFAKLGEDAFLLGQLKGLQDACKILDNAFYAEPVYPSDALGYRIQELEKEARRKGLLPETSQK